MSAPAPIRYRVVHETTYAYSSQVSSSRQIAHLTPRETSWQHVVSHGLSADPAATERNEGVDYFGNKFVSFLVEEPHNELIVRAESEVIVASQRIDAATTSPRWEESVVERGAWSPGLDLEIEQYRVPSPTIPLLPKARAYAAPSFPAGRPWLEALLDLTVRIKKEFVYDTEATTVDTGVFKVLDERRGVCQDYAHLMLSSLRSLGIAARYVSGYILNRPRADGTRLTGADASHAWVAAHCPGLGWVAFDPTNGKLADQEFITLGWGREFLDVTPLRGVVLGSATQQLSVAVSVTPLPAAATAARA
ncbi:MAG TPA: transglutaminase family protein [Steroidobacteraceae bacterium]|nr:transglutaminase family protein [Steroidobacteraceae bacterium]